ncbi:MAG: transcriptional regulator [Caldilineaceae bacterium SB0661_bin_34]|nr:transcriptional regulator [Caldilineaceae bacterium SB0661_bin_34]
MSGRHPFNELIKDFSPKRRRRIDGMKRELLAEMPLHELCRAMALTQRDLAKKPMVNQPVVSKLEQRADMYVSSLRSYVEAMGGQLKIVAEFPEGEVSITNLSDAGEDRKPLTE